MDKEEANNSDIEVSIEDDWVIDCEKFKKSFEQIMDNALEKEEDGLKENMSNNKNELKQIPMEKENVVINSNTNETGKKTRTENFAEKLQKCASIIVRHVLEGKSIRFHKKVVDEVLGVLYKRKIDKEKRDSEKIFILISLLA